MRLHFPSVAVGVVAVSLVLVSMSVGGAPSGPPRIEYGPHPRDMVQIREGTPYVVPAGKLFVLTGLGTTFTSGNYAGSALRVNGQNDVFGGMSQPGTLQSSVAPIPLGYTVPSGSTIEAVSTTGNGIGFAWGYTANH